LTSQLLLEAELLVLEALHLVLKLLDLILEFRSVDADIGTLIGQDFFLIVKRKRYQILFVKHFLPMDGVL
jgi:hypothetical protein